MKNLVLILLLVSCNTLAIAQKSVKKTQVDNLIALSDSVFPIDEHRAIQALEKADSIARTINYAEGIFTSNLYLASSKKYKPLESRKHLQDVAYLLKTASATQKTDYYLFLGFSHSRLGDKSKALENYFKADSIAEFSNSPEHVARANDYIAGFYFEEEAYAKALQYIRESLATYKRVKNDY